jgi:hypothetical protein
MKFHLNYTPRPSESKITHHHSILLTGSCFSENIGKLLSDYKYKTLTNPSGILYNPVSILNMLNTGMNEIGVDYNFIINRGDQYLSFLHHSSVSAASKKELSEKINAITRSTTEFLKEADFLIITLGTAFVYYHRDLKIFVANCHKLPQTDFEKRLMQVDDIVSSYRKFLKKLHDFNPRLKVIFTVSPVKHLRDGVEENNISKATLLLSISKIIEGNNYCSYFPAFELVNDDLRDYRFYKEDLAHPNEIAINYVWEKFSECYFDSETGEVNRLITQLRQAMNHRPIGHDGTEDHKLLDHIISLKARILKIDPNIRF